MATSSLRNNGDLFFVDYTGTGLVGAGSNFLASPFLINNLDDVAPLVGPGSILEPDTYAMVLVGLGGLGFVARRRK